jgi:hypothetical protein
MVATGNGGCVATWNNTYISGGGHNIRPSAMILDKDQGLKGGEYMFCDPLKRESITYPDVGYDGSGIVFAWEISGNRGRTGYNEVFASRYGPEGGAALGVEQVSGTLQSPAARPCVAAGAGTTLVAYEKHPATADVPIKIGFRLLRAAP